MRKLNITFACGDYPRLRPLLEGLIQAEGIDLNFIPLRPHEIFFRMLRHEEFDASELSLSAYIIDQCSERPRFVAIPFFPLRVFRHSSVFVNRDAGIRGPADLKGRKVGVPEYHLTAALWVRGFLQHDYGVCAEDVEWYEGGIEETGRTERLKLRLPDRIRVHQIPPTETLSQWIERGAISALISPHRPPSLLENSGKVDFLFPNFREVEREYFLRTGILPIMHAIAVRRELYEKAPWVAQSLYKALTKSSSLVEANFFKSALRYTLPWLQHDWEEAQRIFGREIFPAGIESNRKTLQAIVEYSYEQGMASRRLDPLELFAPNTIDQCKD